jgi:hypothetical protein
MPETRSKFKGTHYCFADEKRVQDYEYANKYDMGKRKAF